MSLATLLGPVAERLRRSVVQVRAGAGAGAGVVWGAGGTVVTNAHVAHAARVTVVGPDGTASARPFAIIAAMPTTLPSASATGPPEFPGSRWRSACTHACRWTARPGNRPSGSAPIAWNTPALMASFTPRG